ncbi:MAG: hypothetical protein IT376_13005 [Polyangiaceae bacterium]|nr:hypothetical protein [Polyangiaceae bacterium]
MRIGRRRANLGARDLLMGPAYISMLLAMGLAGCSASDSDRRAPPLVGDTPPPEVCEDVSAAWSQKCAECGGTVAECDGLVEADMGTCNAVVGIRDREQLYDECLPWVEQLSCNEWAAPGFYLIDACVEQLYYRG